MSSVVLYDYWRSSASYRVRIALKWKSIAYASVAVDLTRGEQRAPDNLARNPQGRVPTLAIDGLTMTQSLAIVEYLDETRPTPPLLPADAGGRQRVRALAHAVAMDIHPVCNVSVADFYVREVTGGEAARQRWMFTFMEPQLAALEAMLKVGGTGRFCHGDDVSLADVCLVPQVYNARRWGVPFGETIARVVAEAERLEAFALAHPDRAHR